MPAVTSTTVAVEQMVRRNNGRHEGGYRCVGRRCDPCARPSAVSGQEPPDRSEVSWSAWTAAAALVTPVCSRSLYILAPFDSEGAKARDCVRSRVVLLLALIISKGEY